MVVNKTHPSQELYRNVRAGFVAQGSTLTAWCRERRINPNNARAVLIGSWDGPKGRALREKLIKAANISKIQPNGE
ncbi:MAG: hypothetical protein H7829_07625 [Magnetococcus sp. THC-1_WYH]